MEEKVHVFAMSARAQKKWDELDTDHNDKLDGDEVFALAQWVYSSFRPGQQVTEMDWAAEAAKIMRRCDKDENGSIGREEFAEYYEMTSAAMFRCDMCMRL